jgi:hypothetical protein
VRLTVGPSDPALHIRTRDYYQAVLRETKLLAIQHDAPSRRLEALGAPGAAISAQPDRGDRGSSVPGRRGDLHSDRRAARRAGPGGDHGLRPTRCPGGRARPLGSRPRGATPPGPARGPRLPQALPGPGPPATTAGWPAKPGGATGLTTTCRTPSPPGLAPPCHDQRKRAGGYSTPISPQPRAGACDRARTVAAPARSLATRHDPRDHSHVAGLLHAGPAEGPGQRL